MNPAVFKKGDRLPSLAATVGFSLTGWTVVFSMQPRTLGSAIKINAAAAVLVDAAAGTVRYDWAAVDVDTAGRFVAEFVATETATGKKRSYPQGSFLEVEFVEHLPRPA